MNLVSILAAGLVLLLAGCKDSPEQGDFAGLVDIGGGRKLYLECEGKGSPVVVLIAGKGGPARVTWRESFLPDDPVVLAPADLASSGQGDSAEREAAVFQQVRQTTRVCAYDRPNTRFEGADLSTPIAQPHSAGDAAADLHALLAVSAERGPYVLVAHSYGGYIAELFARRYPDQVAGLVMVDAGSPYVRSATTPERFACWDRFHRKPALPQGEGIEPAAATDAIAALPPMRVMPTAVLSAQKANPPGIDELVRTIAGCEVVSHQEWMVAQQLLASALHTTNVVAYSGHFIQAEQPAMVVDAIRKVVDQVRDARAQTVTTR
jgi:pimeloyl-ACP methyl ester carboxylesterase